MAKKEKTESAQELAKLGVVIVGHVDHGKSTLIGRLLYDTGSFMEGKYEELKEVCERRNVPFEWSFLLDAFQAERDQAVTIDTTQIWFKTKARSCVIIDAPGHREFLKNMVSGAAFADAAILVVDAKEGVREQTKRHAYLLHLLGLKQVIVVMNKMDLVSYSEERFNEVSAETEAYLGEIGLTPLHVIPVSARSGENIAAPSENMPWYMGGILLDVLDTLSPIPPATERPLRLPVQDVYRFDETRIIAGRIESGVVKAGDTLVFSPSNRQATVVSIEKWNSPGKIAAAGAGESIGLTLDQPIYVARGDVASHEKQAPMLTNIFRANIFWLGKKPLKAGLNYKIKLATHEATVTVQSIDRVINTDDLSRAERDSVQTNEMAEVTFRSRELLALDPYLENVKLGRCVVIENYDIVGGGIISMEGLPDLRQTMYAKQDNIYAVDHLLTGDARAARNGHTGAVVWLTGLSGAGKSTLAMRIENVLFNRGMQTYVLDGDNVRTGLCADLGFTPEARMENIRRVGEVAALMSNAGLITLTAFISPFQADRRKARDAAGTRFYEIYVKADLETCEKRDPKGLYKKARAGKIPEFTGISSPYEPPENPDLEVDTATHGVDACVEMVVNFILDRVRADANPANATQQIPPAKAKA
ncbi:MAG: adenylyl-sulfate kinase [Alphaproteobacteria bacterium]|nr:adenylyl-sulfate kinase [Alphaproteobacteria bacterium]